MPFPFSAAYSGPLSRSRKIEDRAGDEVNITTAVCTHSGNAFKSYCLQRTFVISSQPPPLRRSFGSCHKRLPRFHTSTVSPIAWAFPDISGLPPGEIRSTAASFFCYSKGILPVKASIEYPKCEHVSGFRPYDCHCTFLGAIIFGASHRGIPTDPEVAATVKLGSEFINLLVLIFHQTGMSRRANIPTEIQSLKSTEFQSIYVAFQVSANVQWLSPTEIFSSVQSLFD